jgi:multimeric flavodoxin WrbA
MKVLVLGGSPKGEMSVTMQYVEYLRLAHPDVDFKTRLVARDVKKLERDGSRWSEVVNQMHEADLVLWAFPLYILLVCAQMKRFIELLFEREGAAAFAGVHTATLSTSIKFFDNTAHEYVRAVSEDLGMRFVSAYSAQMSDLQKTQEQQKLLAWFSLVEDAVTNNYAEPRRYAPLPARGPLQAGQVAAMPVSSTEEPPSPGSPPEEIGSRGGQRAVILTDADQTDNVLQHMTQRIRDTLQSSGEPGRDRTVEVHHLSEAGMRGGCMGCMKCGFNYECSYTGKDGFIDFFNEVVRPADLVVFVGRAHDRYLSSTWKQFFDRSFFNTHTPVLVGKQVAFVIGGPFSRLDTLREVLRGWMELQRAHNVGFVSDEFESVEDLNRAVDGLSAKLRRSGELNVQVPQTFLGVAGTKVFRDDIWGGLKLIFGADHRAYKKMGIYDFPQKRPLMRVLAGLVMPLLRIRWFRNAFYKRLTKVMPMQFRGALERAKRKTKSSGTPTGEPHNGTRDAGDETPYSKPRLPVAPGN